MTKAELITYMLDTLPAFAPGSVDGHTASRPLSGEKGVLDSLGLVTYCFEVEQWASAESGTKITLVNDALLAEEPSPFRTLDALADAVMRQVKGNA